MVEVLVFGSANIDFITYVKHLPHIGEIVQGTRFEISFGGKGANQCIAAARLGARTALVAKIGKDSFGNDYYKYLRAQKVLVDHVQQLDTEITGIAHIAVSEEGANQIHVAGANDLLDTAAVQKASSLFNKSKILLCQMETPAKATIAALSAFKGISILNASSTMEEMPKELFTLPTIFCINRSTGAQLTGSKEISTLFEAKQTAQSLIKKGVNTVILTLGSKGVVFMCKDAYPQCIHVPAQLVEKVVDTNGAGDAFIGGLAYYMCRYPNLRLEHYISGAQAIASISIQEPGKQTSFPDASNVHCDFCSMEIKCTEI